MPLQNRVTPTGEIIADPARGLMMGNRGCLHGTGRTLGAPRWRSKAWICCVLTWKDVRRDPMPPSRWTALFFLDEATALAAGHRPCAYCRRPDYVAYTEAWRRATTMPHRPKAPHLDQTLHAQRLVAKTRHQQTHLTPTRPLLGWGLPDGVMIRCGGVVGLVAGGRLHPWTSSEYLRPVGLPDVAEVELLTPPATVLALAAGYRPWVHPTVSMPGELRVL